MAKDFYSEFNFLLKISTLFFVLLLGAAYPKLIGNKSKNLTLIEKSAVASNSSLQGVQKIHYLK